MAETSFLEHSHVKKVAYLIFRMSASLLTRFLKRLLPMAACLWCRWTVGLSIDREVDGKSSLFPLPTGNSILFGWSSSTKSVGTNAGAVNTEGSELKLIRIGLKNGELSQQPFSNRLVSTSCLLHWSHPTRPFLIAAQYPYWRGEKPLRCKYPVYFLERNGMKKIFIWNPSFLVICQFKGLVRLKLTLLRVACVR